MYNKFEVKKWKKICKQRTDLNHFTKHPLQLSGLALGHVLSFIVYLDFGNKMLIYPKKQKTIWIKSSTHCLPCKRTSNHFNFLSYEGITAYKKLLHKVQFQLMGFCFLDFITMP